MAWFLFIDESGQDHKASPYEVLAGIAVRDETLWRLVNELHDAEVVRFGRRYSGGSRELKGTNTLKTKVFQHAQLSCEVLPHEIPILAKECLDDGEANNSLRHLKALALAKIGYVSAVFSVCHTHHCRAFASIVEPYAPRPRYPAFGKTTHTYLRDSFISLRIKPKSPATHNMASWFSMNWKEPRVTF